MDVINKERKCILLTAKYVIPKIPPSLGKKAFQVLIEDLSNIPLWLMPVIIVIYIGFLPVTIYELFRNHRINKLEYYRLIEKYYNFRGHQGEKHIFSLWHEYGLNPVDFFEEEKLAECLSKWIENLYDTDHHISKEKIIDLFESEHNRQVKLYSRGSSEEIRVKFVDFRVVVVDILMHNFPKYA